MPYILSQKTTLQWRGHSAYVFSIIGFNLTKVSRSLKYPTYFPSLSYVYPTCILCVSYVYPTCMVRICMLLVWGKWCVIYLYFYDVNPGRRRCKRLGGVFGDSSVYLPIFVENTFAHSEKHSNKLDVSRSVISYFIGSRMLSWKIYWSELHIFCLLVNILEIRKNKILIFFIAFVCVVWKKKRTFAP